MKIFTILTAVVADSDAEAERLYARYKEFASPRGRWPFSVGSRGRPVGARPDSPLLAGKTNAIQTVLDLFTKLDPARSWTPADIASHLSIGGVEPVLVGSPRTVAGRDRALDR